MHGFRGTYRVTFLTALTAGFALPSVARADFYIHYWEDQHELQSRARLSADVGYYSSPNNYDGGGNLLIPTNFSRYSRIQTDLTAAYGFTSRFSGYARLGWTRGELDQLTQVSTGFGFTDSSLGLSLRILDSSSQSKQDGITIDLQAQGDVPLYSNTGITGPPLGDGTTDITGGIFACLPIGSVGASVFGLTGGAGFTFRTSSFSNAVPWSVAATLKPRADGLSLAFKVLGLQSLNSDPRAAGLTIGSTTQSAQSGGSFIANAVNPSLITVRGELGYQFARDLGVTAFLGQSVWGMAAPNGLYMGAGLTAHLGGARSKVNGSELSALDYGRSNQGFINYSLEAHVTRVNDRLNIVKIDRGAQDGVEAGQTFDIFTVKKDGNVGQAIARGHVSGAQQTEAALTIDEYFKEIWIDEGFLAKRPVQ